MPAAAARRTPSPPEPATDVPELAGRLRLAATRLARQLRRHGDSGLSPTLAAALATIGRHGPMTLGALADHEQVARPTVTRAVDRLEAVGYVVRSDEPADRRITYVTVTDAGHAKLAEARARKDAWLATRLGELDPADAALVAAALPVLERLAGSPGKAAR